MRGLSIDVGVCYRCAVSLSRNVMLVTIISWVLFFLAQRTKGDINSHKCLEVNTFGYSYDALYKVTSRKSTTTNGSSIITFFVKAQSDAHILMASNPKAVEEIGKPLGTTSGASPVAEIVLGGGKNTFSEIRLGTTEKRPSFKYASTPGIMSADEFRGFWIELHTDGNYVVGREGNATPILDASPGLRDLKASQVIYFGISTWNHVKGSWKFNCENDTGVDSDEEIDYKGVKKLRRDMISFYDPNLIPELPDEKPLNVTVSLHIHHFSVEEKSGTIHMTGKALLKWNDVKLQWDPTDYDSLTSFLVPAANVWTPDLESSSNLAGGLEMDVRSSSVMVASNGDMTWTPTFRLNTFCDLEVADWPRDVYDCSLDIGISMIDPERVILIMAPDDHWDTGKIASSWEIKEFFKVADSWGEYQYLNMHVKFTRKSSSYMAIFSAPFLASSLMILASLWLKHDSPVKLHLRCISMLVLTVFFIAIGELMPAVSSTVPTIVGFYICGIQLACFAIIHYVIIKNVNNFTYTLPSWFQQILNNPLLQTLFCLPGIEDLDSNENVTTKNWLRTGIAFERMLFIIYLVFYVIIWTGIKLF